MTEIDKKVSAYADQIVYRIERMMDYIDPESYDYDEKLIEKHVQKIDEKLRLLKHKMIIEHNGMQLTSYPIALHSDHLRKVICLETGIIYESLAEAGKATGINSGNISSAVRGIIKTAGGYHWEEYEDGTPPQRARHKCTPVLCVETEKEYLSIKEAEEDTGIKGSAISRAINGVSKTAGGYHWRKIYVRKEQ